MTEIKWFKLDSHTFDRAEFKYLGKADENGALYQLCWIKLLCEAAKRGEGGRIYIYKDRCVSLRELSILIDMDEDVICDALSLLVAFGMVKYDETSGLVIKNFSEYVGEGYGTREEYADPEGEEEFAEQELSEEEAKRERNREAQRRWRERQKERKATVKETDNDVILRNTESNDTVINSNSKHNDTVIQRNTERNENNAYTVISSPKNIFIEENRIEESRIEDKRKEEIRKEKTNNNLSHSLSDNAHDGFGVTDGDEDKSVSCKGASHTLASPPPAHAEEKEREEIKCRYGIFNNVYLTESELTRLRAEFGDTLSELIDDLSLGMESEGRSYNNHFATLLRWGKNQYAPRVRQNYAAQKSSEANAISDPERSARDSAAGNAIYATKRSGGDTGEGLSAGGGYNGSGRRECGADRSEENSARSAFDPNASGFRTQKKDSYRGGFEPIRNLTREEAEEAFRLALERSAASG